VTERAAALSAALAELPDTAARLRRGLPELHALLRDVLRAAAPANPQYERERVIARAPNPRELVFLFGYLSESENEAALLLDLIADVLAADGQAPIGHLVDEAWYYLRTSIDVEWQLDDGAASASAALVYLFTVLTERIAGAQPLDGPAAFAPDDAARAKHVLVALRAAFA
jgi:hypothetical protein